MNFKALRLTLQIILLLVAQVTFSQQKMNDYNSNWKKVDDLEKKGLTKSAKEAGIENI